MLFKQGNLGMRLLLSFVLSLLLLQVAQAQAPLIPEELHEFAKENGCSPIEDFYEDTWNVGHPYVYGYLPGPKEESAVLWCRGLEEGKEKLFLLFMFENTQHELAKCPHKIEWKYSYPPLGLSVYNNQETDLGEFVYLADRQRKGPEDKMTNNAILNGDDGGSNLFYCYEGEWLVRSRH